MADVQKLSVNNTTYDISTTWSKVTGKPDNFEPVSHGHTFYPGEFKLYGYESNTIYNTSSRLSWGDTTGLYSIYNPLVFPWYNDSWYIGNIRSSSTPTWGFGIGLKNDDAEYVQPAFRVTYNESYINDNKIWHTGNLTKVSQLSNDIGYKSIDTTYSAGTGLSLSSTTFSVNYGSTAGTACQGNDSRLSDARPASDVYSWAKAASKPTYTWGEISAKPTTFPPSSHNHQLLSLGDATIKYYSMGNDYGCGAETMCIQSCFDAADGETHAYPTTYGDRCIINLQPRGGVVGVGVATPKKKLDVNGDIQCVDNFYINGSFNNADSWIKFTAPDNVVYSLGIRRPYSIYGLQFHDGTYYYDMLHEGNSSVSKSGETLTVKINGISQSLTNTNTTYSTATSSTLGLVKIGYTANGKNYPVQLSNGQMYVNVPWTDTNTDTNTWRGITDSVSTTDSTISASATAVKTAYDKANHSHDSYISKYSSVNTKDMNTIKEPGIYYGYNMTNSGHTGISNFIVLNYSNDWGTQLQFSPGSDRAFCRFWQGAGGVMQSTWKEFSFVGHTHSGYAASSHTHDDRYYTESEVNTKLSGKSDTGHTHTSFANNITVTGSVSASSGFYQSSDERLKTLYDPIKVDLEKLKILRKNYFKFNDKDKLEIGVSAQEIQNLYPEIVSSDDNGYLSVAYDKLSVIALAAIDELDNKYQKEINDLKDQLKAIKNILNEKGIN